MWRIIGALNLLPSYVFGVIAGAVIDSPGQRMSTPFIAGAIAALPVGTIVSGNPIWLLPNCLLITASIGVFMYKCRN